MVKTLELEEFLRLAYSQLEYLKQLGSSQQRIPTMPYQRMKDLVDNARTFHRQATHWARMIHRNGWLAYVIR